VIRGLILIAASIVAGFVLFGIVLIVLAIT
jgi:hypothetical protein